MKSLELFSGAGGLAKGLELSGFEHVQFVEFDKNACKSLRSNFHPNLVYEGDIRDFDFSKSADADLIAGGPPCQPFSLGGKHRAHNDQRDMFPYAVQAVNHHRPKAFIFENVKGLLRKSFAQYFEYVIKRLTFPDVAMKTGEAWEEHLYRLKRLNWSARDGLKYKVQFRLLNAADFGVPQVRERVFIVGVRSDIENEWVFPEPTHSKAVLMEEQNVSGRYWERHGIARAVEGSSALQFGNSQKPLALELTPSLKPWRTVRDALVGIPHPDTCHGIADHIFRGGAKTYPGHTGSFIDAPAKTLKAGGHGVPGGENMIRYEDGTVRYFTVYEGKLLQTFAPDFQVLGAWGEGMRQIGNAVPTLLAKTLGRQLFKLLNNQAALQSEAA